MSAIGVPDAPAPFMSACREGSDHHRTGLRPSAHAARRRHLRGCDRRSHEERDLPKGRSARSHCGRARDASEQEQERESENVPEHVATRRRALRANESLISSRLPTIGGRLNLL